MANQGGCVIGFIVESFAEDGSTKALTIRDRGILSNVKTPLLALGRLLQGLGTSKLHGQDMLMQGRPLHPFAVSWQLFGI